MGHLWRPSLEKFNLNGNCSVKICRRICQTKAKKAEKESVLKDFCSGRLISRVHLHLLLPVIYEAGGPRVDRNITVLLRFFAQEFKLVAACL